MVISLFAVVCQVVIKGGMGVCACNREQEKKNAISGNSFSKHELVLCFMGI